MSPKSRDVNLMKVTRASFSRARPPPAPPRAGGSTGRHAQTTQKRELVVAQGGDIAYFDPHFSTSSNDIRVSFNIFDNLTSRHPDGKLHPGLATEWKLQGQTTWVFKLRPGVKCHNGDPFTSADAKCSLERTCDPSAEDAREHRAHHDRPDRGARIATTARHPHQEAGPAAARAAGLLRRPDRAEEVPRSRSGAEAFNPKPVGTGPVRFVSWTKDDKVVLEANPDYWGGKIDFDRADHPRRSRRRRRAWPPLLKGEVDIDHRSCRPTRASA